MVGVGPQVQVSHENSQRDRVLAGVGATFNWQAIGGDFNKRMTYKIRVGFKGTIKRECSMPGIAGSQGMESYQNPQRVCPLVAA